MKRLTIILGVLLVAMGGVAQAKTFTVKASTQAYNRLMFPVPYTKVVIPPDAQMVDKPISLQQNLGILIRPDKNSDPFSIFVQLVNGEAFTVRLKPSASAKGAVFRYKGATDVNNPPPHAKRPKDGWMADVFVHAMQGKTPAGFQEGGELLPIKAVVAPATKRHKKTGPTEGKGKQHNTKNLNTISLSPIKHYKGSGYDLKIYRLSADLLVNVEPRDFYRKGVVATAISNDVVGPHHQPKLVVLEVRHER